MGTLDGAGFGAATAARYFMCLYEDFKIVQGVCAGSMASICVGRYVSLSSTFFFVFQPCLLLGNPGEERSFESLGCRWSQPVIERVKEQKKKKEAAGNGWRISTWEF